MVGWPHGQGGAEPGRAQCGTQPGLMAVRRIGVTREAAEDDGDGASDGEYNGRGIGKERNDGAGCDEGGGFGDGRGNGGECDDGKDNDKDRGYGGDCGAQAGCWRVYGLLFDLYFELARTASFIEEHEPIDVVKKFDCRMIAQYRCAFDRAQAEYDDDCAHAYRRARAGLRRHPVQLPTVAAASRAPRMRSKHKSGMWGGEKSQDVAWRRAALATEPNIHCNRTTRRVAQVNQRNDVAGRRLLSLGGQLRGGPRHVKRNAVVVGAVHSPTDGVELRQGHSSIPRVSSLMSLRSSKLLGPARVRISDGEGLGAELGEPPP